MLWASDWDPVSADFTAYCDACPEGLEYWFPSSSLGFCASTPENPPTSAIFWFEALCVLCALQDVSTRVKSTSKIVIYTDNLNTVQIFNSLACVKLYILGVAGYNKPIWDVLALQGEQEKAG